jgi:hypothetical protein
MDELGNLLQEYVATANNPEYNSDWDVINSKFPELSSYDSSLLQEYVATANNSEYDSNWEVINSKFPELFDSKPEVASKGVTAEASGDLVSPSASTEESSSDFKPNKSLPFNLYPEDKDYQNMGGTVDKIRKKAFEAEMLQDKEFQKQLAELRDTGNLQDVEELKEQYINKVYNKNRPVDESRQALLDKLRTPEVDAEIKALPKETLIETKYKNLSSRKDFKYKDDVGVIEGVKEKDGETVDVSSKALYDTYGEIEGLDMEDFNGYVEKGNDRIKKLYRAGYFTNDTTDVMLDDTEEKEIREAAKHKALAGYVTDRVTHLKGKHLGLVKQGKTEEAKKVEAEIKKTAQGYSNYVDNNLKNYKKAKEEKLLEEYNDYNGNNSIGNFKKTIIGKPLHGLGTGISNASSDMSAYLLDLVGADDSAEYERMVSSFNKEFDNDSLLYGVASGKKVNHNGKEYLVSENGRIIDTEAGKDITVIADKLKIDKKTILEKSKVSQEEDTSYSASGLLIKGSEVLGNLIFQIAGTKGIGGTVGATSRVGTLATSMSVQSGMVASSVYEETLSQLRDANIDDEQAKGEALSLSMKMGAITALTSLVSPNSSALGVTKKSVDKQLVKDLAASYVNGGKDAFKKTLWDTVKKKGIDMTREGFEETLQELTENVSQNSLNVGINERVGKNVLATEMTKEELIETFLLSHSTAGLMALNGKTSSDYRDKLSILEQLSKDVETSTGFIKGFKEEGAISEDNADKMIKSINQYAKYSNKLPNDVSLEKVEPLLDKLDQRNELELRKKNEDKAFHTSINEQIGKIDEEISGIINSRNAIKGDVTKATPAQYAQAMSKAMDAQSKSGNQINLQVDAVSEVDAQKIVDDGGKLFMTKDGKAGGYVMKDGYMGGLFKDPSSNLKNVAKVLQEARIQAGGKYFDAYGTKLEDIYIKNGFKPVARLKFNEEYAEDGWDDKTSPLRTKPDVVFFAYDPEGQYKKGDGQYFTDYDQAKEFTQKAANNEQNTQDNQGQNPTPEGQGTTGSNQEGTNKSDAGNVSTSKPEIKKKGKEYADKVRKFKINSSVKKSMSQLNSRPTAVFEVAWDGALEVVASTVELTANVSQAIYDGVENLKGSDWYKGLSPEGQKKAERMFKEDLSRNLDDSDISNNPSFKDSMKASFEKVSDKFIQKIVDKFHNLRKEIDSKFDTSKDSLNFSNAEKLMHGKAAEDLEAFDKQMTKFVKKLAKKGFTIDEVSDYLYAKHASERNAHIKENIDSENEFGSGMTPQEIDKVLNQSFTDEQIAELEELSGEIKTIIDDTRKIMLKSGLINQEQYNSLSNYYENYVPLHGFQQNETKGGSWWKNLIGSTETEGINQTEVLIGNSFSVDSKTVKRAGGRSTRAGNVIASIIAQRSATVMWARKNEVLNTLHDLGVEQAGNNDVFTIHTDSDLPTTLTFDKNGKQVKVKDNPRSSKEYVGLKVNGEQKYLKFANKELGRVLNAANIEKTDLITKTLGRLNRYLSTTLTTLNPEFVISNFARDIQTAVFNVMAEADINKSLKGQNIAKQVVKDTGKSIKAIFANERGGKTDTEFQKYYDEFKKDGAKTGWANQNNLSDIKKKLENLHNQNQSKGLTLTNVKKGFSATLDFVNDVNTAVENGVRLSAYVNARKAGASRTQAAVLAKELTVNFNQSGEYGTLANTLYLFFNAAVQGNVRFIKAMTTMKKTIKEDGSTKKSLNRGQKIALSMVAFSSVITMLNQAIADDDEDGESFYSKIPDYEKERNLIFMNPVNGKDYFKIPLPYGYNIFHNMGTVATEVGSGERTVGDGIGFLTTSTIGAFSPVSFGNSDNPASTITRTVVPTAIKPILDLSMNEDFFGSQIYNEKMPFSDAQPDALMGRKSTPEAFKNVSMFLNEISGGNDFESGNLDFAPESMYYMYKFFAGGVGNFAGNVIETGSDLIKGDELESRKTPFVRKVYGEPNEYVDQEKFFDRSELVKQRAKAIQQRIRNNEATAEDKRTYSQVKGVSKVYEEISKKLSDIRKKKKKVQEIDNPTLKKRKLQKLDELYFKLLKKANGRFNDRLGKNYE